MKSTSLHEKKFWHMSAKEVASFFKTDVELGLSTPEVEDRFNVYGPNVISTTKKTSWLTVLFNQLKSPLILVLIVAGVITLAISHYHDAVFIFIVVVVNSALGFYQENKAEKALAQLKTYLRQRTRVIRDGKEKEIDAEDLVPGDIIRLAQGGRVPADARVIYVNDFQVDEAVLTGESLPVVKTEAQLPENAGLNDQDSMVFAGTLVTQGICTAIVCRTSTSTELGKIASFIAASEDEQTPLQAAIIKFSVSLSIFLGILVLIVFVLGIYIAHYSALDMFLISIALAVSAIPSGLPVSMTVILTLGVERMAKRKGVVRKLVAAEALGSTSLILTDKTGTLTMAKMVMSKIIPFTGDEDQLLNYALTNASVLIENPKERPENWHMNGRIMEAALVQSSAIRGMSLEKIMDKRHVLQNLPFNATQKFSASLVKEDDTHKLVFFGAPDILLSYTNLSVQEKEEILVHIEELASRGERVLGVAVKEITEINDFSINSDFSSVSISLQGLITFHDPVRPGIAHAIERVKQAGIKTVIMTGDHRGTAVAIAKEIGLKVHQHSVLDASELIRLSEDELKKRLSQLVVISRVTPFDKLHVVKLYQEAGEIVAMTGDGVNDAPAIKQANVGVAMGSGTEVSQNVADLVLLDDNYETIVAAVEEGRQILLNIRKVIIYLLSSVLDGLILIGFSLLAGLALPLNALQILWVNFFTDSFPAVAFAFERDPDSLAHKPRKLREGLFDPLTRFLILVIGILTSVLLFVAYYFLLRYGFDEATVRTFIFAAFSTYTLILTLSVRSLDRSILSYPLFSNKYLIGSIVIGLVLTAIAVYMPLFQSLFGTVSLSFPWIVAVVLFGVFNIILIEIAKAIFHKRNRG